MPSTGTRLQFIEDIAKYVIKYAPQYGILVHSPIIAQAVIESKYGESGLAKYHNYFGLKCGSKWIGKSVNMKTKEEYVPGVLTDISDNFRVYDSMEEGVKGYFDFINRDRYSNLKGVTDPKTYTVNIKNDGYATSSTYVSTIMKTIDKEDLTRFDGQTSNVNPVPNPTPVVTTKYSPDIVLSIAQSYLGASEQNGRHKEIIDIYNNDMPLPSGYRVKYTDAWCATFVSACAIKAGYKSIIPKECSCERMIGLFKNIGCWQEDESVTPQRGWVIFYDWEDNGIGDNVGHSDHVGYVLSVFNGSIQVIEGNYKDAVGIRTIGVNGKCIRGYGVPKYTESGSSIPTPIPAPTPSTPSSGSNLNKDIKFNAKVIASSLNVRSWAGTNYPQTSFSPLKKDTVVGICDTIKDNKNEDWHYIKYNGKGGFCSAKYLERISDGTTSYAGTYSVNVNSTLNMRSQPGTNNPIIAKLPKGARVICEGNFSYVGSELWLEIVYNNIRGYCSSQYLIKL